MKLVDKLFSGRPLHSYAKVRHWYGNAIRGRKFLQTISTWQQKQYLNIGCGSNIYPHFINLDYEWRSGVDICWDVTKGIPLKGESLKGIYTEHCLEHLHLQDAIALLAECYRLLQPGGRIRIVVPDAELYIDRYTKGRKEVGLKFPYGASAHDVSEQGTPLMVVNQVFRGHGHLYAYDFVTLKYLLCQQGFVEICQCSYRQGVDENLLVDTDHRACESLYVEARKPSRSHCDVTNSLSN